MKKIPNFQQKNPTIKMVVFDWAGTCADLYSRSPAVAIMKLFLEKGISLSESQARLHMGRDKWDHLFQTAKLKEVSNDWLKKNHQAWTRSDIDDMYQKYLPLQKEIAPSFSKLIPGLLNTIEQLKKQKIIIAVDSGYPKEILDQFISLANSQGFSCDYVISAENVPVKNTSIPTSRPHPWILTTSAMEYGIYPMYHLAKVGDTLADVYQARNAGCWSIAVWKTGNMLGEIIASKGKDLSPGELLDAKIQITEKFKKAGAHFIIPSIKDIPEVVTTINEKLKQCEKP